MFVISLGGSVLFDDTSQHFDTDYAARFLDAIKDEDCIVVCGGGVTARKYVAALPDLSTQSKDNIGIAVTRLHARCLYELALHKNIPANLAQTIDEVKHKGITIMGGTTPGHTTDYVAVAAAQIVKATKVINISNIKHIYDKDPKDPDARPFDEMTWVMLRKLVGSFSSGMHAPFDPKAVDLAEQLQLEGIFIHKDAFIPLLAQEHVAATVVR